jgi:hypothetical protein
MKKAKNYIKFTKFIIHINQSHTYECFHQTIYIPKHMIKLNKKFHKLREVGALYSAIHQEVSEIQQTLNKRGKRENKFSSSPKINSTNPK